LAPFEVTASSRKNAPEVLKNNYCHKTEQRSLANRTLKGFFGGSRSQQIVLFALETERLFKKTVAICRHLVEENYIYTLKEIN